MSTRRFDILGQSAPASAFLWKEIQAGQLEDGLMREDDVFVFQYWPETLDDAYTTNYDTKVIPGGSHPLFQWTGGGGREVSFTAIFTTEIDPGSPDSLLKYQPQRELLPSARYTVDINAAVAKLQSFMRPKYVDGDVNTTEPPPRLYLALNNTLLGGDRPEILVVLKGAPVSYQAWFPSGYPRIVEVSCSFSEVVQRRAKSGAPHIKFIGRSSFEKSGRDYKYRGSIDRVIG
jgi:hypothetical protein